ncbi:MAG: corrinoid protein [Candidatus Methanomethylicus sp.]|nr:corrinoid protein [Candidatus Methanomethylicus sp.]
MKEEILKGLAQAVIDGDLDKAQHFSKEAIANKIDAYEAIMEGCAKGMNIVSQKYETGECFVPEVLCSAEAMTTAMDMLKPYLKADTTNVPKKVVIGTTQGDVHEIGKNLVTLMLEAGGFKVIDLGPDVSVEKFVETVKKENADICAMSSLMTTSMIFMPDIIKAVKAAKPDTVTMVGGGPLSPSTAETYGADGYAKDASVAVKVAKELTSKRD